MKNLQRFKKQQPTSQRTPGGSFKSNFLGDLWLQATEDYRKFTLIKKKKSPEKVAYENL